MTTMGAISVQEDWRIGGSKLHRIVVTDTSEAQSWSPILEGTMICRRQKPSWVDKVQKVGIIGQS